MFATLLTLVLAAPPVDAGLRGERVDEVQGTPAVDFGGRLPPAAYGLPDDGERQGAARPPEPQVRIGKVEVEGPLAPEVARRVLAINRPQARYCYEVALRKAPALQGRIVLRLKVDPAGTVASVEVAETTLKDPVLDACLPKRAARWRFPAFPGPGQATIRAPLTFLLEE